jgi:hypothetical protein
MKGHAQQSRHALRRQSSGLLEPPHANALHVAGEVLMAPTASGRRRDDIRRSAPPKFVLFGAKTILCWGGYEP